ncbi:MAG: LysR substrate-binding domain-containing protein [Rhizobiaceae bacterium]
MAQPLPPLAWFRAFECAARHLSFTHAAQELNLTQSAISQHIRSLEARFGSALFVRKHRGIALTDQGRRLLPEVASAISILRSASETFETPTDKRLLTISVSTSLAQWYLAPRLKKFSQQHPDLGLRIISKVWPDEFAGSNADVEIRFDAPGSAEPGSTRIGSDKIVTVAAPDLVNGSAVRTVNLRPHQIAERSLIQVLGTSDSWTRWAAAHGYEGLLNITCNVESHGAAVDFARAGTGIALTSFSVAAPCLLDGSLILLEKQQMTAQDGYYLTIAQNQNTRQAEAFSRWLQAEVQQIEDDAQSHTFERWV